MIQHDRVRWADILAVAVLAASYASPGEHPSPACRNITGGCPGCRARVALARLQTAWRLSGLDIDTVQTSGTVSDAGLGSSPRMAAFVNHPPIPDDPTSARPRS